ncbi:MAG: delta-1-pyrroline-5-carboxylate dehydrogenase [Ignavibacteria bacterium]|nr:delta-1-pyrroline-5-carboxylate dehydrogenase [Ignavibacteria bacterium]
MKVFKNNDLLNWNDIVIFSKQKRANQLLKSQFGKEYPNKINGQDVFTKNKTKSLNPANPEEVVGIFQKSGKDDAEIAIQAAAAAFESWKNVPVRKRAEFLTKAAYEIRRNRVEICSWMTAESGKNFIEADGDLCEAVDFLEFYALEAKRYAKLQPLTQMKNEINKYFYIPLGVGVCIPPWNFPFAIMIGITAAALVTGNTVVLKPSSETPMMAWLFSDIMYKLGLPDGVLNFLVASGAEAGDYLVEHPKTRFISFTGSMEVGLRINELAAKASPMPDVQHLADVGHLIYGDVQHRQIWIKRVIAEMGGKDTIIVDSEVEDLDVAVADVVASAYGFQGQKCSACSRVIVDAAVYDEFNKKLKLAVEKLQVGDPTEDYKIGPVISAKAEKTILEYIEIGKKEGKLLCGGTKVAGLPGYYIQPTVFIDIDPKARISQEEIFGPVLAVIKSNNFEHALEIANNTIYGLTGAVFTKNRDKIELATNQFHVGNLYFNRKCTGAMVDVHPFGGFNMSGTDSKAGSRDYLMLFQQGKLVSEKVIKQRKIK